MQVDMTMFCADGDGRDTLTQPWVKGGYRYATDGRWVARVPTTEPDTDDGRTYPDMPAIFAEEPTIDATEGLPPLNGKTKTVACPRGYPGECPDCSGDGSCTCFTCDHEHECGSCEGTGSVEEGGPHPATCECGGSGGVTVPDCQQIGAAILDGVRVQKLMTLAGIRVNTPVTPTQKLGFVADGGLEGFVAPVTVTRYDHKEEVA